MRKYPRSLFVTGLTLLLGVSVIAQTTAPAAADPESPAAQEQRLAWFRHDKFGLFIHWGLTPSRPATGRASARPASASGSCTG